ncbi:hypothetical protein BDP27DRAFT_1397005 [Rhodocollybia butyracea]|uniref:Uncharacterized protein n=1 Tax=Rhodocollybia butyracea TaxID=206335 RepID=A0A9P5QBC1_9AGAR|nr:hypothetical protein BDP27DRAFT_1397005 [Rhodocollybia butyracea]
MSWKLASCILRGMLSGGGRGLQIQPPLQAWIGVARERRYETKGIWSPKSLNLRAVNHLNVTSLLNARYVSSAVSLKQRRKSRNRYNISTLDPERLVASDFIDIGDRTSLSVFYKSVAIIYRRYYDTVRPRIKDQPYLRLRNGYQPYPPGTHGYLYLHRIPDVHQAASTLRFRICDKDLPPLESFSKGRDLVMPKGVPWEMNMWQLMDHHGVENVFEGLLDNVISPEVLQQFKDFESLRDRDFQLQLHSHTLISTTIQRHDEPNSYHSQLFNTSIMESEVSDLRGEGNVCTMCLDYDPEGGSSENSIVLRVLQIPQELRGKTLYNEGDTMPFIAVHRNNGRSNLLNALLRQSPSLSSS